MGVAGLPVGAGLSCRFFILLDGKPMLRDALSRQGAVIAMQHGLVVTGFGGVLDLPGQFGDWAHSRPSDSTVTRVPHPAWEGCRAAATPCVLCAAARLPHGPTGTKDRGNIGFARGYRPWSIHPLDPVSFHSHPMRLIVIALPLALMLPMAAQSPMYRGDPAHTGVYAAPTENFTR